MSDSGNNNFDEKIRKIYHDRNIRLFSSTPDQKDKSVGWVEKIVWLLLTIALSSIASLLLVLKYFPSATAVTLLTKTSENKAIQLTDRVRSSTVEIFFKSNDKTSGWKDTYLASKALGQGLVLSSDGWVITTNQVVKDINRQYAVAINNDVYSVFKIIKDSGLPFIYLKVKASGLVSTGFIDVKDVNHLSTVAVIGSSGQGVGNDIRLSYIASWQTTNDALNSPALIQDSEVVDDHFILANNLPLKFIGSPVISADNRVVGLLGVVGSEVNVVYPLKLADNILGEIFSDQEVSRSDLGIKYINMGNLLLLKESSIQSKSGMLVISVDFSSPFLNQAVKDIIKSGDIITEIGGQKIDGSFSLSYLLQQFDSGSNLSLSILRDSKVIKLEVKLGKEVFKSVDFR